uniref:NACHT LRR and PYD domain-containing protein n=1 Tax=Salarias fasciatus TaxID=181472 RepID=A0A672FL50_SALFA
LEVYFCYLFTVIKHHALKGSAGRTTPRSEVLALAKQQLTNLGKLAYQNLLQTKIIFSREDLKNYGVTPADIQSTFLCAHKEETVETFSFFHLTVQEHLAALYCATNLFSQEDIMQALDLWCFGIHPSSSTVALLQSNDLNMDKLENLQMFTRFFMGMLRARLAGQLEGLIDPTVKRVEDIPTRLGLWFQNQFKERKLKNQTTLNLLHCLMEFHIEETTSIAAPEIKTLNLFKMKLSVVDCAAMHYVLQFSPHSLKDLRYNCLDKQAAVLESEVLKSNQCQVKKLYMCGNNLGPEGVLKLWNALEHNTTVEELYLDITGITERGTENITNMELDVYLIFFVVPLCEGYLTKVGRKRLRDLEQCRPDLRIIANFVDDLGLLQAYLDWVEEIQVDRDQMDSVKNADALQSVLNGLRVAGVEKGENAEKAKELQTKIEELLKWDNIEVTHQYSRDWMIG